MGDDIPIVKSKEELSIIIHEECLEAIKELKAQVAHLGKFIGFEKVEDINSLGKLEITVNSYKIFEKLEDRLATLETYRKDAGLELIITNVKERLTALETKTEDVENAVNKMVITYSELPSKIKTLEAWQETIIPVSNTHMFRLGILEGVLRLLPLLFREIHTYLETTWVTTDGERLVMNIHLVMNRLGELLAKLDNGTQTPQGYKIEPEKQMLNFSGRVIGKVTKEMLEKASEPSYEDYLSIAQELAVSEAVWNEDQKKIKLRLKEKSEPKDDTFFKISEVERDWILKCEVVSALTPIVDKMIKWDKDDDRRLAYMIIREIKEALEKLIEDELK